MVISIVMRVLIKITEQKRSSVKKGKRIKMEKRRVRRLKKERPQKKRKHIERKIFLHNSRKNITMSRILKRLQKLSSVEDSAIKSYMNIASTMTILIILKKIK